MKRTCLTLAACAAIISTKAQLTLDHEYQNVNSLSTIKLEDEGHKYVVFDTLTKTIKLYNTDHSLWKTMPVLLPGHPNPDRVVIYPSLISTKLFNLDSKVEMCYYYGWFDQTTKTQEYYAMIINEDGNIILKVPGSLGFSAKKIDGTWKVISTPYINNTGRVYSVPGSLPDDPQPSGLKPLARSSAESIIYPNPVAESAVITYILPQGIQEASLKIYAASGQMVKQMTVTSHFDSVVFQPGDLSSGVYYYEVAGQKQQFVIK